MTPSELRGSLERIADTLQAAGVPFALVGGLAVSVRTEPRFTRDVDLAISVADDGEAEKLVRDLMAAGYHADKLVEHTRVGRLATARLIHRDHPLLYLDLLFASSGVEREICEEAEVLEVFENVRLPVASLKHLIVTKVLAVDPHRPKDDVDLQALLRAADAKTLTAVVSTLQMVEARGYGRSKDLVAEFEAARRRFLGG